MTLGPETTTGRDVQGSGGRRNPAGSGRGRSWPTPILCHDLPFFTRGEELLAVHQWASRSDQARQGGGYGRTNSVHIQSFFFVNVTRRNILTFLMTHGASGRHHSPPCTAPQRDPPCRGAQGTLRLAHSRLSLAETRRGGSQSPKDGSPAARIYLFTNHFTLQISYREELD